MEEQFAGKTVDQEIEDILKEHPGAEEFDGEDGERFVFDKPTRPVIARFNAAILAGKPQGAAENMLRDTRLYPDKAALESFIREYPAAVSTLSAEVMKLAGGDKKFSPRRRGGTGN